MLELKEKLKQLKRNLEQRLTQIKLIRELLLKFSIDGKKK